MPFFKLKRTSLVLMFCVGICAFQAFMLWRYLPDAATSRDVSLAEVLAHPGHQASELVSAQAFCEAWTNHPSADTDCRTGRLIDNLQAQQGPDAKAVFKQTVIQARERINALQALRKDIAQTLGDSAQATLVLQALDMRLENALPKIQTLELQAQQDDISATSYAAMFELLLDLQGQSYQSVKGSFRNKRWDVAQLIQHQTETMQRGQELQLALKWLPLLLLPLSLGLFALSYWRAQFVGVACMAFYLVATLLGLLITADASVHFGENSLFYPLNPLGNQLYRQIGITGFGYVVLMFVLIAKRPIEMLMRFVLQHSFITTCLIASFVVGAYLMQSPAIGSESMKLGVAILAGVVMTDQSRVLHLIRKYAPDAFSFSRVLQWLRPSRGQRLDASARVLKHIAKPLSIFCVFALVTLGAASLVFNDLGGALISTLMVIITLFLTFGSRPTLLAFGLLGLSAALLSLTDKLQGRIELMLAPMTANVSDFARLLAFTEASSPHGFGLGNIAWCNQEGTCLPIQVLSDYMPTALNGVSGPWMTLLAFLALCAFFLTIAAVSCWRFITRQGVERLISIVTFFLLTATLIQTILTFLGNWRLIPLTGMGTPLLSIGLSSILAPTLALGFFLAFSASQSGGHER